MTATHNALEHRVSPSQLKRAAGSQSLDLLKEALVEYSPEVMDAMEGKNPLHMAAWRGCLENIAHLLEIGCDINAISTGEFSYGKTPIFFALTQSRNDAVDLLLDRGAKVKIVNNKGQSVLSIAASHLEKQVVEKIALLEGKETGDWTNYRATHSDGLEYGDLDPRFLDRPLRNDDVITDLCINPTTKESRRGAFSKRNPGRAAESKLAPQRLRQRQRQSSDTKLSPQEEQLLQDAWSTIESKKPCPSSLRIIVSLSGKLRKPWMSDAADRIRSTVPEGELEALFQTLGTESDREKILMKRLYWQVTRCLTDSRRNHVPAESRESLSRAIGGPQIADMLWTNARRAVQHLSMSALEKDSLSMLVLPHAPVWVDGTKALASMASCIESEALIGFDSEWSSGASDNQTRVSTLQIASQDGAWLIDLTIDDEDFRRACQTLIATWFSTKVMLGFACKHDLHLLSDWCGDHVPSENCLDLQMLWMDRKSPPGLATCVQNYTDRSLSKAEQCSDWRRRPLSDAQLHYAGLDAAILLYLLAEWGKSKA